MIITHYLYFFRILLLNNKHMKHLGHNSNRYDPLTSLWLDSKMFKMICWNIFSWKAVGGSHSSSWSAEVVPNIRITTWLTNTRNLSKHLHNLNTTFISAGGSGLSQTIITVPCFVSHFKAAILLSLSGSGVAKSVSQFMWAPEWCFNTHFKTFKADLKSDVITIYYIYIYIQWRVCHSSFHRILL